MYDQWAATYDQRWRRYTEATHGFLLRHLAVQQYRDILDVACGTGTLLARIREQNAAANVYGIDRSIPMLGRARARLCERRVDLQLGDACRLPYPDCSMDLVCLTSALHYLRRPSTTCAEIRCVLRPSGILIVVDYRVRALRSDVADGVIRLYDRDHVQTRLPSEARAVLTHAGFRVRRPAEFRIGGIVDGICVRASPR